MMISNFDYKRAHSIREAALELTAPGSAVLAGGTDLSGALRDGIVHYDKLVSISNMQGLTGIRRNPAGGMWIGALTSLAEMATNPHVEEHYPVLSQAAAASASPQIRNQATIGGNLCQRPRCWYFRAGFPCLRAGGTECFAVEGENEYHAIFGGNRCFIVHPSDPAPALVALDAQLKIESLRGSRVIPIADFFLLPAESVTHENRLLRGQIITEVILPARPNTRSLYRKVRARAAWGFALAGVALVIGMAGKTITSARVVLSGVAPIPWRSTSAENVLLNQDFSTDLAKRAAVAAAQGASPLSMNVYKVDLVKAIVEEELTKLLT
jgi:xanthine dehydrogenase YagS FAD-binding subunit